MFEYFGSVSINKTFFYFHCDLRKMLGIMYPAWKSNGRPSPCIPTTLHAVYDYSCCL